MDFMGVDYASIAQELALFRRRSPQTELSPGNAAQEAFVEWYMANESEIRELSGLTACFNFSETELNEFMQRHGRAPSFRFLDGCGFASVFDRPVAWNMPGIKTTTNLDGVTYPAFETARAEFFSGSNLLIRLETSQGPSVWLLQMDSPPTGRHELFVAMADALADRGRPEIGALRMPMVDLETKVDLTWLLGLGIAGHGSNAYGIGAAQQYIRWQMNHIGAGANLPTATAIISRHARPADPYVVGKPFVVCMTQPGSLIPIAPCYITPAFWKEPGAIM